MTSPIYFDRKKKCTEWSLSELLLLHHASYDTRIVCSSLLILPAREGEELHDSGYRIMRFIPIDDEEVPICIYGNSDVIHFGGIGGRRHEYDPSWNREIPWSVDCLPKSGLLRIFASGWEMIIESPLSSFELLVQRKKK